MHASLGTPTTAVDTPDSEPSTPVGEASLNLGTEEQGLAHHAAASTSSGDETARRTRPNSIASSTGAFIKRKTSELFSSASQRSVDGPLPPKLAALVDAYATSEIAADIKSDIELAKRNAGAADGARANGDELPDIAAETTLLRGRKRASLWTQFRILSGRAFKNLYRDPALLTAHYTSSVALACEFAPRSTQI